MLRNLRFANEKMRPPLIHLSRWSFHPMWLFRLCLRRPHPMHIARKAFAKIANFYHQRIIYHFYFGLCHSYFHGIIYANSNGVKMSNEPLPLTICISSHSTAQDDRHLSGVKSSATITTAPLSGRHFEFSPKHLRELILHEEIGKKVHNLWRNTQWYIKTSVPSLHAAAISYLDVQLIEHLCMLPHASTRLT